MKHLISVALCIFALFLFSACASLIDLTGENGADTILSVTADPEPYLGKEFILAGYYTFEEFTSRYHYVLLPSDEGQNLGFEIRWEGDYPQRGTPVRVRGVLKGVTEFGQNYIYLDVSEFSVLQPVE